jgi:hypothetical protein
MNTTITATAAQAPRTPIKAMSTTYTYTPTNPAPRRAGGPGVSWRHRLARWFRLRRKQQAALPASAQGPPRLGLGPIGDDLRFRGGTGSGSLVGDLSSLKFDDRGSLQDFKLSFDASSDLPRLTGGASAARAVGSGSMSKRPPQSAKSVGARADVPSIDLPTMQDGGFLDTWLKQTDRERKEKEREAKERERRAAEKARREAEEAESRRKAAEARAAAEAAKQDADDGGRSKRWSTASDPRANWAHGPAAKRARGSDIAEPPPLAPPKTRPDAARQMPAQPTVTNAFIMAAVTSAPGSQARPASWRHSTDASAIAPPVPVGTRSGSGTTTSLRRLSAASTQSSATHGTGSETPGGVSAGRPSRFEVRTDALLKPVSSTSAAATAREVSATISRINTGSMAAAPAAALSRTSSEASAAAAAAGARRTVTDSVKALHKPDGSREPSRRFSQPAIRNSYHAETPAGGVGVDYASGAPVVVEAPGARSRSRTPTPTADVGGRPRRPSSQLSDRLSNRMSWLRELEDGTGRAATGRDYVFNKLQGGVAAKLAALENKGTAVVPAAAVAGAGIPRSESRASNVSASEAYGIEAAPIVRSGTAAAPEKAPGSIADVVDDGFKRRLEGSLKAAQEQQEKAAASASSKPDLAAAGSHVARMAAARKRVPRDVLDLIALSGVDEEVAINEYLQHGNLGRTKTWDHEEIMRQVAAEAGETKAEKVEAKPEVKPEQKVEAKAAEKVEEKPAAVQEAKAVAPVEQKPEDKPEEKTEEPAVAVAVAVETPAAEAVKVEGPAVTEPAPAADSEEFKAAALPALA